MEVACSSPSAPDIFTQALMSRELEFTYEARILIFAQDNAAKHKSMTVNADFTVCRNCSICRHLGGGS